MERAGRMDGVLLTCVLLLCLVGVLMVYSSSTILAQAENRPETAYLRSQFEKLVLGLVVLAVCSRMPYRFLYGRAAWWALGVSVVLLTALLLPVGLAVTVRGTRRFLNLGFMQLQPAEFARLALILFLAWYASRREDWIRTNWRSLAVPLAVIGLLSGLTVLQPNLSSAVVMAAVGFCVLWLSGQPLRRLIAVAAPLGLVTALTMKGYQLHRIFSFWNVLDGGETSLPYQVRQSLIALGSGGLFGQGIGQGLQKYHYLPFPHTDFILGIVGEETGFIGILALFTFYGIILLRGLRIARGAPDRFSALLAAGLTMSIAINFFLHSIVALGMGPVTGVPLPFVSHGGSSLVASLAATGLLLSISRHARPATEMRPGTWRPSGGSLRTH